MNLGQVEPIASPVFQGGCGKLCGKVLNVVDFSKKRWKTTGPFSRPCLQVVARIAPKVLIYLSLRDYGLFSHQKNRLKYMISMWIVGGVGANST